MEFTTKLAIEGAYALGVGILIGLERSVFNNPNSELEGKEAKLQDDPPIGNGDANSGVRTYATFSLVGFIAAVANEQVPFVAPVILAGLVALVLMLYRETLVKNPGMTTEAAAIGTAALGALCHGQAQIAAVLAVTLTAILSSKHFTHGLIKKMRRVEVTDTLKFLVIILIVVPLLPNKALDPYGAINLYKIGILVVLISGISFVGYFLTRILGAQKGLGLTGLLGGLTSSTAVTVAMAKESKESDNLKSICAFSTVIANATSFFRVLIMVVILDLSLAKQLAWSIGGMGIVACIASLALWFLASKDQATETTEREGQVKLKNPFSLGPAINFALFFVAIILVSKVARSYLGDAGLYLAAAFSGLADVDAITLSVAEQCKDGALIRNVGVFAITIAVVSNAIVKTIIAMTTGSKSFGRMVAFSLGSAVVAGLALAWFMPG
jgi:uncharacterized membrane protein (DUF4010 family)